MTDRHPSVQQLLGFFAYHHLPADLQHISRHFAVLADIAVNTLPESPELTVCLRKLLEAKDCAVRCAVQARQTNT